MAHGVVSSVTHNGSALFSGIPSEFKVGNIFSVSSWKWIAKESVGVDTLHCQVVRYHSWIVDSVPETLETIAWTTEDR